MRVLVVDDNGDIVATTIALLRRAGHDAKGCDNGTDVYDCVREYDPDVVLLDINLPGQNGFEVVRQIRTNIGGKRPVIIGITASPENVLGKPRGFDYRLIKPVEANTLMALIATARSFAS
jgi:DNA-binding response OmpR family regulator